jgi:hypothetical protein
MPDFTYLPGPEDGETTRAFGYSFTTGEWTPVSDSDAHALEKLRSNRLFGERQEGSACDIPLGGSYPNAIADTGSATAETVGSRTWRSRRA